VTSEALETGIVFLSAPKLVNYLLKRPGICPIMRAIIMEVDDIQFDFRP